MAAAGPSEVDASEGGEEATTLLENGRRLAERHGHGLCRRLIGLIDESFNTVDAEDAFAQHFGHRSPANLLDHQSEQEVVGVRVLELLTVAARSGRTIASISARRPDPLPIG